MKANIRKIVVPVEKIGIEAGRELPKAGRKAITAAVIETPCAEVHQEDLSAFITMSEEPGELLASRAPAALGGAPEAVESYGKAALIGENGELEHGAALPHPKLDGPVRKVTGGRAALVPSSKKRSGPGQDPDVPLGHKHAAFVRPHFDGAEIRIHDAPHPNAIVAAVGLTDSGPPLPRVGGLEARDAKGADGLR